VTREEFVEKLKQSLFRRRYAYRQTLKGPLAEEVLMDLARFCRAHASAFDPDPRTHAVIEGRREVWLRIAHHLNLSEDQLWQLYSGRPADKETV